MKIRYKWLRITVVALILLLMLFCRFLVDSITSPVMGDIPYKTVAVFCTICDKLVEPDHFEHYL